MPGNRCAIAFCNNNSIAAKKEGKTISFHHFPKDDECRNIWITRCRRKDEHFNPKYAVICSEHFEDSDFQRNLKSELLGHPARKILKSTALPTQNIVAPKCKRKSSGETSRANIKNLLSEKAIDEVEETLSVESTEEEVTDDASQDERTELQKICIQQQEMIEKLKKQLHKATCHSNELQTSVSELEQRLNITGKLNKKKPIVQVEVDLNSEQETQELEESLRNGASNKKTFTDIKIKYLEEEHRLKMVILNIEKENAVIQNETLKIEYEIKKIDLNNKKICKINN